MDELHIYLRVSSDTQKTDGFGLENQKELGLKVSKIKGMKPIIHNEGSKSSNLETIEHRPILKNLLIKIDEGDIKNLWVYQMDRLSRNDVVSFQIRQKLKKNNVKLFVNDSNEYELDNPTDKLMFTIMEGISEFDNSIRTERLRRGKLSKIKNGGWKGGPPPYGYEIEKGELKPNNYEKKWVKKIYEEYLNGQTIYQIKKYLMKNGVLSRRGNIVWSDQSIRKILENTHFEGYYFYTDKKLNETVRVQCPQILPLSLIKKVRQKVSNSTYKSNYIKYDTLLRDFLVCGHCGSKFGQRISKSQYKNHYFCRGNGERLRSKEGITDFLCKTDNGRVRSLFIDDTDTFIWSKVVDTLESSNLFKEIFKKEVMKTVKSYGQSQSEIRRIERKIKKNEQTVKDINETINSNVVEDILDKQNKENFKSLIKQFENKKLELLSENEELTELLYSSKRNTKWVEWVDQFGDKIKDLRNSEMDVLEKRKFLEGLVEKIVVLTKDKQTHSLEIQFLSPFVGDELIWNEIGKPKKGYVIKEGEKNILTYLQNEDIRLKKKKRVIQ